MRWTAALILGCAGCAGVGGNGESAARDVPIDAFTTLVVADALVVDVSLGAPSAAITGEGGLIERIRVRQQGTRLDLTVLDDEILDPDVTIRIRLTTPTLDQVTAREASAVSVKDVSVPGLVLEARDGSRLRANGTASTLSVVAATAADVDARALEAAEVGVDGRSASTIGVFASRAVRGLIADDTQLFVRGGGDLDGVEIVHDAEVRREP